MEKILKKLLMCSSILVVLGTSACASVGDNAWNGDAGSQPASRSMLGDSQGA